MDEHGRNVKCGVLFAHTALLVSDDTVNDAAASKSEEKCAERSINLLYYE